MGHMDFATGKLTITDNIYNQILLRISDGIYAQGEKLPSESELCKIYKASRISIRSALQRLEAIGLIETFQGKGSYVKTHQRQASIDGELTPADCEEFWQFRQALGDKALELFALNAKESDLEMLERYTDKMINSGSQEELVQFCTDFFMYIYQNCGNQFIANAFSETEEVLNATLRMVQKARHQSKAALVRWYEKSIEFLRSGDSGAVAATIAEENVLYLRGIDGEAE